MDTADLLAILQRRIIETARDRDRLDEAVTALDGEIAKLETDEMAVRRLVSIFSESEPPATVTGSRGAQIPAEDDEDHPREGMVVRWPSGPGYTKPLKVKKAKTWAWYKFDTADWYLDTLKEIARQTGLSDRTIGVEMAIEGMTGALCSSVDAAIYALTNTIERTAGIPDDRRTPSHLASWSKLAAEARYLDIELASSLSISNALIGEHSETPQGWLAQLQILRNRSSREDITVIRNSDHEEPQELCIDVPAQGPMPILEYLSRCRDLVEELLETIFYDVSAVKRGRAAQSNTDRLHAQAERDLERLLPDN
ncbi:MAG TPA: hypothetical protein VMU99_07870 [Acidimicrobiales bacterium]|nr:hypothetical protein [Acidimicrobiales bacterium]